MSAAGTGDIPVAEEASITAEVFGNRVVRLYDVGVAGIHRLLSYSNEGSASACKLIRNQNFTHSVTSLYGSKTAICLD